jgi:hypothetical protein
MIHKVIFKNTENTTLDSIQDKQGNILTNPKDIADESTSNSPYSTNQPYLLATTNPITTLNVYVELDNTHGTT